MSARAIRLGFLGGGLIARYHAVMLAMSGVLTPGKADVETTIAAVHDPDATKAARFASETGATVVDDEAAVLDSVDAVFVCTWTAEHPRLVREIAARGLPVFCEKPLATSYREALEMVRTVEQVGVINQVGLVMRDYPGFLQVKRLLARPGVGRPMAVVFRDDQYIPTQGMYDSTWRSDPAKAGAGVLIEHSIHDIDILEWLFGPIATVNARSAEFHGIAGIEDSIVVSLAFESGLLGSLTSVWHDVLERPSLRHVEIFTEGSYCAMDGDIFGPVRWTGPAGESGSVADDELIEHLAGFDITARNPSGAFVRSVAAAEPAAPSFSAALRAHLVTEAIYRSCVEGGASVSVPEGLPAPS